MNSLVLTVRTASLVFLLTFLLPAIQTANALASTIVYGPQSRELLLLVSKIAAHQGLTTSCICAPGTEEGCRRLMYGSDYATAGIDKEGNAKPISDSEEIGAALNDATSMALIAHDSPVEVSTVETFLKYSDKEKLQKLVLLSKMGVKSSSGGFFGGGNKALLQAEEGIAKLAKANNLDFSIVRAGNLKGGGPGLDEDQKVVNSLGLDKTYYNSIIDVVEYKVTLAHDKFSLGADTTSVFVGDPHTMPNMMTQIGTKTSFDPSPTDTNRIVAASAAVAALEAAPLEISVGVAEGKSLPTTEEWNELFQTIQQSVRI